MRFIIFVAILLSSCFIHAQTIYIPYREGGKFGLCDEKGKVLLKPQFDRMEWKSGQYFISYNDLLIKDTVTNANGASRIRDEKIVERGLLFRDKVVIENGPYTDFEIIPNKCIVAASSFKTSNLTKQQYENKKAKQSFVSIFSLDGKNVYPENFKRIQKFDTAGTSSKDKSQARYMLFGTLDINDHYGLFVFDIDKQIISDWLIKDAVQLKITKPDYLRKNIVFECTNSEYVLQQKMVDYSSGQFKIIDLPDKPKQPEESKGMGISSGKDLVQEIDSDRESYNVAVPPNDDIAIKGEGKPYVAPAFKPFHQNVRDTLFWVTALKIKEQVKLPEGAKPIYSTPNGFMQYNPVVYKLNNKYGWVMNGMVGEAKYDSIVYFGKNYMMAETIGGKRKYGLFDDQGKAIIPAIYDSMYNGIKWIELDVHANRSTGKYDYVLREADEREMYAQRNMDPYVKRAYDRVTVFQNGKAGVINLKNEWLIPMKYDLIADNSFQYTFPRESKYIILKRDNLYGITQLKNQREFNREPISQTIEPVFPHMPCFVIHNFQVKGFNLIGLYDPHFEFVGFANNKGLLYFKP